nr:TRASH domain-containing protein [Acidianus sp. RZ1]
MEYEVLQLLKEDSRLSASEISEKLGVSRVTISRIISSLKEKGIKFTVEFYEEGEFTAFIVAKTCFSSECYNLIEGGYMNIVRSNNLEEIHKSLSNVQKDSVFVSYGKKGLKISPKLVCDYCGGEINEKPIKLKIGNKIYYACCNTCYTLLKKKKSK